jgi:replicative DNA helicase
MASRASEAGVVGSMLLRPGLIPEISEIATSEMFTDQDLRLFFSEALDLYRENNQQYSGDAGVDALILHQALAGRGKLKDHHVDLLRRILETLPSAENGRYYAKQVRDRYHDRQLAGAIERLSKTLYAGDLTAAEKRAAFEQAAFNVNITSDATEDMDLKDLAVEAIAALDSKAAAKGVPTGFARLDEMLGGCQPGELVVVAGRPSMGKTALALSMFYAAAKKGKTPAFFTMEMSPRGLVGRLLAMTARISLHKIAGGYLGPDDYQQLLEAATRLTEHTGIMDGTPMLSPAELAAKVLRHKAKRSIEIAFVDYLQLMYLGKKADSRQQEITLISSQLKALAKRADIPIVVMSQLNRDCERRRNHKPRLSDLRESGSIEQDADKVLLLHRDDYYRAAGQEQDGCCDCMVAKNRQGPTGTVKLMWLPEYTSFENYVQDDMWDQQE